MDDGRGKDWYASFGATTQVTTIEPLIRQTVQLSISEGNSTATNYGAALGAFGGGAAGGLSGFSRTPEGKATVAAFMDVYNKMVISLRNYKAQEVKGGWAVAAS